MRRFLLTSFVALQTLIPFAASADNVIPQDAVFVRDPAPEWSKTHELSSTDWDAHRVYHQQMHAQLQAFEAKWRMRYATPEYFSAKRDLLRSLQLNHRVLHATVGETPISPIAPVAPEKPRVTGRAALFTVLPKRSHRIIEREIVIFENIRK